jgi:anti-sigma-K factor RskA
MIDERHEELASLYALDLLEGAELTQFEAALARDANLRRRVEELRAAAAALAHLAPPIEPPAGLKQRILASAAAKPAAVPAAPQASISIFPLLIPWAAAACLALTAAWMTQLYFTGRTENRLLLEQQQLADFEVQTAHNQIAAEGIVRAQQLQEAKQQVADADRRVAEAGQQVTALSDQLKDTTTALEGQLRAAQAQLVEADRRATDAGVQVAALTDQLKSDADLARMKITTLASMLKNSPQALAVAVWDPARQRGVLSVSNLPALAADQDYQLWVVDPQYSSPVNGGIFRVDPTSGEARITFHGDRPVASVAKFAVSLERKGGVPKAEGPMVLLSQ